MSSFILKDGLPSMRFYYTYGNHFFSPPGAPGPADFLPALLAELTGLHVAPRRGFGEAKYPEEAVAWVDEGSERDTSACTWTAWGRCGGPAAGFRWESRGDTDSSARYSQRYTSYGLPGMALRWSMEWWKSGYVHSFHHTSLSVEFSTAKAKAQFHDVWQRVFGQPAVLEELGSGDQG
jgi:hypothetical protein